MRHVHIAVLIVLSSASILSAQRPKVMAPHRPIPHVVPKSKMRAITATAAGSMIGGVWMIDADFKSRLYLRNVVETAAVTVTPILHLSNGEQYKLAPVQLEPAGTAVVDINAGLQNYGIAPYATLSGYVEVKYNWPWTPICATVQDLDVVHSLIFDYDLRGRLSSTSSSPTANTVQGLWWKQEPNVSAFVALANVSARPIKATLQVSDSQANPIGQYQVTVSPQGMKMIPIQDLQITAATVGGMTVTYNGAQGDLMVNGGLEDRTTGYSAALPFADILATPLANSQPSIAELGLMVGPAAPMMSFPASTTFTPYSVLRNVSNSSVSVSPTLWWMAGGSPHSFQAGSISIQPLESTSLDIPALLKAAGLAGFNGSFNLTLDAQGSPGSLLTAAGSVDQNNTYVFTVTPHGVVESAGRSLSYWSTADGTDTMVTIWNPADEAQDFIFRLYFSGGHYDFPIHLAARETRSFNISEIINTQVPDAEGNIIPADVHEGSAKLVGAKADNQLVLVAMDAGTYNVKKATCGYYCESCDGWVDAWIDPASFSVNVNNQTQVYFIDEWNTGEEFDLTDYSDWISGTPSTVSVDYGQITGLAGGSASVEASDPYEPVYVEEACLPYLWSCPLAEGTGDGASGNVYDPTPVINSITNQPWPAGLTTSFTIYGSGFGTNPSLTLSGTGITSYNIVGTTSDTQINASVTVSATAPSQNVTVTVTSDGYNGSGFMGQPGQSDQGAANATVSEDPPPSVGINSGAPSGVPVSQAQPQPNNTKVGTNEVYISATCSPQGPAPVNPQFNWSITQGSQFVQLDSSLSGGPTMGIIGVQGSVVNAVQISVSCTDLNSQKTSSAQTATMTAQQPSSLSIITPDTTSEQNCTPGGGSGCQTVRTFTYQINDTNGNPMTYGGLDYWDYITTTSDTCGTNSYAVTCSSSVTSGQQTGNCDATHNSNASGRFSETLSLCATACGSVQNGQCSGSCSSQATQTWLINGFPITKSLTYQCNSISVQ
jgi:hypothetical protein